MAPTGDARQWLAGGVGDLRASDADRERTADMLRHAVAEGRLDIIELEERLERTFAAKTYGELALVTTDLPVGEPGAAATSRRAGRGRQRPAVAGVPGPLTVPGPPEITAILKDEKLGGRWLVPPRVTIRALLGKVTLDFTDAVIPHEVVLDVAMGLAQLTLVVPDDIAVEFERGTQVMVSRKDRSRGQPAPGTPRIRVRGLVVAAELLARPPKRRWFRR
ncbi:DUF1707 domain-containing protein [Actinopolymorpha sp. B11F2]|uniref:DUF1707 SHOCT-like domain-containing protein n=1 Tax=Actinopolymorpha sp. B11F2 TaxID=3160862 RepID=UPI0032E41B30